MELWAKKAYVGDQEEGVCVCLNTETVQLSYVWATDLYLKVCLNSQIF